MRVSLLAVLLLAGCSSLPDPVDRPGTWRATGVNESNLRQMVVDPAHLSRGVAARDSEGELAARPIAKLLAGERAPLPEARTGLRGAFGGGGANAAR